MVKSFLHESGRRFHLGRNRPEPLARARLMMLKNQLPAGFAAGPTIFDEASTANAAALALLFGNDNAGDCLEAGMFHTQSIIQGNAGVPVGFKDQDAIALYSAITGYDPTQTQPDGSNPTDQGTDEVTAFQYWQSKGLLPDGSHKIAGSLVVDATNPVELRTAAWLFENASFAIELPDAWVAAMRTMASGFVWDAAGDPNPNNGHYFVAVGYNKQGAIIDTWGMLGTLTYAAIAKYAIPAAGGDAHTVLTKDIINRAMNKAPDGLDWAQLVKPFDALGGTV